MQTGSSKITAGLNQLYAASTSDESKAKIVALQKGMTDMEAALTNLQQQLAAGSKSSTATSSKVGTVLSAMQTNANKLATTSSTSNSTSVTDQINAKIDGLKDSQGLTTTQVDALKASLKDVGQTQPTTDNSQAVNALKGNVSELQGLLQTNAAATGSSNADLVTSFKQLEAGVNTLVASVNATAQNVQILEGYSAQLTSGINELQNGTALMSSNLTKLNGQVPALVGGINSLAAGSSQVADGTGTLATKSDSLSSGASQISNGLSQLNGQVLALTSGVNTLASGSKQLTANSAALTNGATALNDGTQTLSASVPTLVSGVAQLFNGSQQVTGGLTTVNGKVPAMVVGVAKLTSGSNQLTTGLGTLNGKTGELASGVTKLTNGSGQVTSGLNELNGQVPVLASAVQQLFSGSGQVSDGLTTLNGKIPALTSGVQQLADGANKLDNNSAKLLAGNKKIKNGNTTLAKSLQSGADTINGTPLNSSNANMFAAPSKLTHSNYSYVPNYGHALAPYVLSLALYVGAIVFNFAYPIRRIADDDGTATQWFFSKIAVGAPVAILMAIIECIALLIVGLKPISMGGYFLTAIMIALASMSIVMFLSMLLDNPGRFLAMVLLMLQLGGSGGTFPMEITNKFFNAIHPFLPLTYSIQAFRQSLTGGWGSGIFWSSIGMLAGFTILGLVLLWASMVFLKKKNLQVPAEAEIQMKAGK